MPKPFPTVVALCNHALVTFLRPLLPLRRRHDMLERSDALGCRFMTLLTLLYATLVTNVRCARVLSDSHMRQYYTFISLLIMHNIDWVQLLAR